MTLKQRLKLESPLRGRVMSWVGKECLKWDSSLGLLHLMREEASHVHAPGKPRVADDCGGRRDSGGEGILDYWNWRRHRFHRHPSLQLSSQCRSTESLKKAFPRLRELAPVPWPEAGSRNLLKNFLRFSLHVQYSAKR